MSARHKTREGQPNAELLTRRKHIAASLKRAVCTRRREARAVVFHLDAKLARVFARTHEHDTLGVHDAIADEVPHRATHEIRIEREKRKRLLLRLADKAHTTRLRKARVLLDGVVKDFADVGHRALHREGARLQPRDLKEPLDHALHTLERALGLKELLGKLRRVAQLLLDLGETPYRSPQRALHVACEQGAERRPQALQCASLSNVFDENEPVIFALTREDTRTQDHLTRDFEKAIVERDFFFEVEVPRAHAFQDRLFELLGFEAGRDLIKEEPAEHILALSLGENFLVAVVVNHAAIARDDDDANRHLFEDSKGEVEALFAHHTTLAKRVRRVEALFVQATKPKPFTQLAYRDVPALPRKPHGYFETQVREVEVHTRSMGRVRTHVRIHGEGPPLLLVHGFMTTSYSWRYALTPLGKHFTLYMPDLAGCGRSEKTHGPYTPEAYADFLQGLLESLGLHGIAAIGNSLGGYLAMQLVLRDTSALSRLVNLHSPGLPTGRMKALRHALDHTPGWKHLLGSVIAMSPHRWVHRNVHYYDETLKSREEHSEYGDPLASEAGLMAFMRMLDETVDVRAMARFEETLRSLKRFPIPLQLVYARRDPMVPPQVGERLHALLPDAEMVWLEEASHFAHVDATERFVEAVLPFLNAQPG